MLVFVGVCLCVLVFVGVCWCLLVFIGVCWCVLVFVGVCWCVLVFVVLFDFSFNKTYFFNVYYFLRVFRLRGRTTLTSVHCEFLHYMKIFKTKNNKMSPHMI